MPVRSGIDYQRSLVDGRRVSFEGVWVPDVTEHPQLRATARAVADYYDFQLSDGARDVMTTVVDGDRIATSYVEPRTKDELRRVAAAYAAWAEATCGFMGRSPDYMNAGLSALGSISAALGEVSPELGRRARRVYLDARTRDSCYTHTFAEPYKVTPGPGAPVEPSCRVVRETADGLIVRGARALATLAPFSNMNFDLFGGVAYEKDGQSQVLGFVVPTAAPGLSWVCRRPYTPPAARPLRHDEMDCVAMFDDCLIPWDDVYVSLPEDVQLGEARFMMACLQHHVLVRSVAKTRFLLGLGHLLAESSKVNQFINVRERLGEMVGWLRTMEAFSVAAVENAVTDPRTGRVYPEPGMVETAVTLYSEYHAKMISHLKDLGGSRHVSVPHAGALEQVGEAFARYYRGNSDSATRNISLFELAWDVVGSEWGARQELYERFHFGDAVLRRVGTYLNYDLDEATRMVARALEPKGGLR